MDKYVPLILLAVLLILVMLLWRSGLSKDKLRESMFRSVGVSNRKPIGLVLGAIASLLALSSGSWPTSLATWVFVVALALTLVLLIPIRSIVEREIDRFVWGLLVMVVLGFGLGALIYQSRSWWIWIWQQLLRVNYAHKWALVALFLLGAMLGVFVVRNWAKEQKAFIESLSGILGVTFVAAFFVKVFEDVPQMSQMAFSYYALGFAISGTLNLVLASWLTAHYTNRKSLISRAVLDFMYGSERADTIDKYFLKNFENDPDYAKRWLTDSLLQFREVARRAFADKMEQTRRARQKKPDDEWYYYELMAIERERDTQLEQTEQPRKQVYKVLYRELGTSKAIVDSMFRIGISIKKGDFLEYIVAPGEYRGSFPRLGSVLGLALEMRQTIVMDRDKDRKFRNKDHKEGISPAERDQSRGLDEISFLSYVSIPLVSRLGEATENELGVLNIDSKIFVSREKLPQRQDPGDEFLWIKKTKEQLTEMASSLYDDNDPAIKSLEDMREIIRPIVELYARCSVGAT